MQPLDWAYERIADSLKHIQVVMDFEIPAAVQWITVAGKCLYAGAVQGRKSWASKAKRDFGMEDESMSVERLGFWMQRMREMDMSFKLVVDAA